MHGIDFAKMTLECSTHLDGLTNFSKRAQGGRDFAHGATLLLCTNRFYLIFEAGHLGIEREGGVGRRGGIIAVRLGEILK
jgi:hypothetical protein